MAFGEDSNVRLVLSRLATVEEGDGQNDGAECLRGERDRGHGGW